MAAPEQLVIPPAPPTVPFRFVETFSMSIQDFENAGVRAGTVLWNASSVFKDDEERIFQNYLAAMIRNYGDSAYEKGFRDAQTIYEQLSPINRFYGQATELAQNNLLSSGEKERQLNNIIGRTLDVFKATGGDMEATERKLKAMMSNIAKDGAREAVVQTALAEAELRALDIAKKMGFEGSREKAIETYMPQVKLRWQRVANPDACAFCTLVARDSFGQIRTSKNLPHYHDFCRCVAVPLWDGAKPYKPDWYDDLEKKYGLDEVLGRGYSSEEVLSLMRQNAKGTQFHTDSVLGGYRAGARASDTMTWAQLSAKAQEAGFDYQRGPWPMIQDFLRSDSLDRFLDKRFQDNDFTDQINRNLLIERLETINKQSALVNEIYRGPGAKADIWTYRHAKKEELQSALGYGNFEDWVGQSFISNGYLSTSAWADSDGITSGFGNTRDLVLKVNQPKGTKSVGLQSFGAENEILLPPGTTMRVVSVTDGTQYVARNPNDANWVGGGGAVRDKLVVEVIIVEQENPNIFGKIQSFLQDLEKIV